MSRDERLVANEAAVNPPKDRRMARVAGNQSVSAHPLLRQTVRRFIRLARAYSRPAGTRRRATVQATARRGAARRRSIPEMTATDSLPFLVAYEEKM